MSNRITRTPQAVPKAHDSGVTLSMRTIDRADYSTSKQADHTEYESAFGSLISSNVVIAPPLDPYVLFNMIDSSSILPQCIDAIVVNTAESGWEVAAPVRDGVMDADEQDELQSFIDHANGEQSLATVWSSAVRDRESVGYGFVEVIRDRTKNISLLRYAPSITMRLTHKHPDEVLVKYDIKRGKRTAVVSEFKKFRKYVQVIMGVQIYFREFGDPREMNSISGLFAGEQGYTADSPATEIMHIRLPSNDPYGKPRWVAQTPGIIGTRESEEVNMRYFEDNTIPPAIITVAGGRLTKGSFQEIKKVLDTGKGKARQNKLILIEAVGEGDGVGDKAAPIQIKIDKMTSERPSDGLFKEYKEGNQADVRSAFRLPPIAVGMSQDATFATANVSQFVAETQVFAPARTRDVEALNNLLVSGRCGLRLSSVVLLPRTPTISSPEMTMKTLTALNVIGAVTPRSAQLVANTMLQIELPGYPEKGADGYEEWMDQPMPLTIKEAGAAAGTGDPNAQNSHDGQANKDAGTKATEGSGDVSQDVPMHGQE